MLCLSCVQLCGIFAVIEVVFCTKTRLRQIARDVCSPDTFRSGSNAIVGLWSHAFPDLLVDALKDLHGICSSTAFQAMSRLDARWET